MANGPRRIVAMLLGAMAASCGEATSPASVAVEEPIPHAIPDAARIDRPQTCVVDGGEGAVNLRDEPLPERDLRIDGPLKWLARHQSADGSWSSFAFGAWCPGERCSGPSAENETVGVTGLALLAYFSRGETHKTSEFGTVVRAGLKFLRSVQGPEGEFSRPWNAHPGLQNAWATLAMAEAYGMTQSPPLREPAERAVRALRSSQLPRGGWRREASGEEPDLETTAWSVMALRSAGLCGLPVDREDFERTVGWLDSVTDPDTGSVGTDRRLEAETSMATAARKFCGSALGWKGDPLAEKGAEVVSRHPPGWDPSPGAMDARSWLFGMICCYIRGVVRFGRPFHAAARSDRVNAGLTALFQGMPPAGDGCNRGSTAPCEPWGREHGRVAATAMTAMLEAFYF